MDPERKFILVMETELPEFQFQENYGKQVAAVLREVAEQHERGATSGVITVGGKTIGTYQVSYGLYAPKPFDDSVFAESEVILGKAKKLFDEFDGIFEQLAGLFKPEKFQGFQRFGFRRRRTDTTAKTKKDM